MSGALPSERLAVPLGLARSSRLYPALPRWAKLGRPFHGLSVEILWCFVVCILSLAAPALAADHPIFGYDHSGDRFVDVGKPESIATAESIFP